MKKRRKAFLCNLSLLTVMLTFSRVLAFTLVFEVKQFRFCFSPQSASWFKSLRNQTSLVMATGLLGIVCQQCVTVFCYIIIQALQSQVNICTVREQMPFLARPHTHCMQSNYSLSCTRFTLSPVKDCVMSLTDIHQTIGW